MAKPCKCQFLVSLTLFFTVLTLMKTRVSSSSELDILISFKASIEDPKSHLSAWSKASQSHYCNWTGITCTYSLEPNGNNNNTSVTSISLQSLNLSGEISSSVCKLLSLTTLNLGDNLFNQLIPIQLSRCKSLQALNLSNNLIWGTIPDQVSQFVSLEVLDLSKNHIEGKIPLGVGLLRSLKVINFGSNLLSGTVPSVFSNLTELVVLDLSLNTYLVSEIPSDLGLLVKLEQLLLQSSGFYGQIPDSFTGLESLAILDISQNNLTGKFPDKLGSSLKNLVSLDVSENRLLGSFPDGICSKNGVTVTSLTLHSNLFNGSIPESVSECLSLERFQVQNNLFSGDVPAGLWSLPKIKLIRAENNFFSGPIAESIANASQLEQIQIDNNSFIGKIPRGLGHVKSLYRFSASLNGFTGEIPPNFCDSPVMSIVNISHNSLVGEIPELKHCRKLVSLSLAGNSLEGKIPPSLADLPVLTYLDLSSNSLSGPIPQGLQNLKLALLNLSFNHLSGKVPYSLISGLPASFLQGNPGLCGPGLPNSCSDEDSRNRNIGLTTLTCALLSLAFAVSTMIVVAGFIVYQRYHKRRQQMGSWRSVFFYPLRVTEHDLIMGMDDKSALGSGGAFGRVYALSLPSGERIIVKKLASLEAQSSKALRAEIKTLAKIRHKNIIKVLGFFHSEDSIFLIYEFQQNGSLGDLISREDFQLDWNVRIRIAIGVAQGLAYLHKDYVPHLLHRNVKSRNILLDEDFEPKLTDFALDRIVGDAAFLSTIISESPFACYNAPEYAYSKKATEQMDVYSFGVVLLELITGKSGEKSEPSDSLDIVKWVRRKVNIANGVLQVIDPKMPSSSQQEMLRALDIALRCTSVVPEKRPPMTEVVKLLQSIGSRTNLPTIEFSAMEDSSVPV